jgi:hypothetical protein
MWVGYVARMKEMRKDYKILVKPEGWIVLERKMSGRRNNFKRVLKGQNKGIDWIHSR